MASGFAGCSILMVHGAVWRLDGGAGSAFIERLNAMIERSRAKALKLCSEHGITVRPYAGGWWLVGEKINRVVGELAGLCISDISPLPVMAR